MTREGWSTVIADLIRCLMSRLGRTRRRVRIRLPSIKPAEVGGTGGVAHF